MTSSSGRIAVIGAGWAGLACALHLCERGAAVALFDAAPQAGGRARELELSIDGNRFALDNGQHLLVGAYRDSLRLIGQLGGASLLRRQAMRLDATNGMKLRTYRLPAPLHLASGLLFCQGLSIGARLRLVEMMVRLRWARWLTPAATVAELLARSRQPPELIERLWQPLCIATLNTDIDAACAQTFVNVLRDTLGGARPASDFMISHSTLSQLFVNPAMQRLQALGCVSHLRSSVRAIVRQPAGWQVLVAAANEGDHFDQVVLAVPPVNALRLLPEVCADQAAAGALRETRAALGRFEYEPIATTYLWWHDADLRARGISLPAWIQLAESLHDDCFGQWLFDRGSQHGQRLAGVVVSAAARALLRQSDQVSDGERIGNGAARQVCQQMNLPAPTAIRTVVEKRATFRCTPDRPKLQVGALRASLPGVWLAGDYAWPEYPATLEAAVRSGEAAARACLAPDTVQA